MGSALTLFSVRMELNCRTPSPCHRELVGMGETPTGGGQSVRSEVFSVSRKRRTQVCAFPGQEARRVTTLGHSHQTLTKAVRAQVMIVSLILALGGLGRTQISIFTYIF